MHANILLAVAKIFLHGVIILKYEGEAFSILFSCKEATLSVIVCRSVGQSVSFLAYQERRCRDQGLLYEKNVM